MPAIFGVITVFYLIPGLGITGGSISDLKVEVS